VAINSNLPRFPFCGGRADQGLPNQSRGHRSVNGELGPIQSSVMAWRELNLCRKRKGVPDGWSEECPRKHRASTAARCPDTRNFSARPADDDRRGFGGSRPAGVGTQHAFTKDEGVAENQFWHVHSWNVSGIPTGGFGPTDFVLSLLLR